MSIRTKLAHVTFGLSLVTLAAGCPFLEVEAEMPEVCMTHRDVEVAGVPAEFAMGIDETFAFDDLSAFDELKDLDADLRFVSATIRATHGVGNLAFIDAASVQIASNNPDSTLPTRAIYSCASGSCPAQDNALAIPVQDQDDALEYIRSGSMSISLQATGNMPTESWKMDVEICVAGRASYSFQP
jgi:hypothetical protein